MTSIVPVNLLVQLLQFENRIGKCCLGHLQTLSAGRCRQLLGKTVYTRPWRRGRKRRRLDMMIRPTWRNAEKAGTACGHLRILCSFFSRLSSDPSSPLRLDLLRRAALVTPFPPRSLISRFSLFGRSPCPSSFSFAQRTLMTQASTLMFQFIPSVRFPAISYFKRAAVSTTGSGVALETPCLVCLRHRLKLSWLYGSITPDFFPSCFCLASSPNVGGSQVAFRWPSGFGRLERHFR